MTHVPFSSRPPPRPKPTLSLSKSKVSKHLSVLSTDSYPTKDASLIQTPEEDKQRNRESYIQSARAEHGKHSRSTSPFVTSIPAQVKEVMKRRVEIIKGDWSAQVILFCSFVFQAIIMGTSH